MAEKVLVLAKVAFMDFSWTEVASLANTVGTLADQGPQTLAATSSKSFTCLGILFPFVQSVPLSKSSSF